MNSNSSVLDDLRTLLEELRPTLKGSHLPEDAPLGEGGIGLDSLTFLSFLVKVEQHFSVQIEDDHWNRNKMTTLSDIAEYVNRLGSTPDR